MTCRFKVKTACECGRQVEERRCGAYSAAPRPKYSVPKCIASCTCKKLIAALPDCASEAEVEKYAADLHRLALQHRRFLQTLEELFASVLPGSSAASRGVQLPVCDGARRLLAVEYARLHWRLQTSSKADSVEDWWLIRIESSATLVSASASGSARPPPRQPRPLLSELCVAQSGMAARFLSPPVGSQPRLRFTGIRGAGDEVYDLLGLGGLLGVRPGQRSGEVFAFLDKGATAAAAMRRLTGQDSAGLEALPVRNRGLATAGAALAWGGAGLGGGISAGGTSAASVLRVMLDQTLLGSSAAGQTKSTSGHASISTMTSRGDGWDSTPQKSERKTPSKEFCSKEEEEEEEIPDSWEDEGV